MLPFSGDSVFAMEYGHVIYTTESGPETEDIYIFTSCGYRLV